MDYNFNEIVDNILSVIAEYSTFDARKQEAVRKKASKLSEKALWKHFIAYYFDAYSFALNKRNKRLLK